MNKIFYYLAAGFTLGIFISSFLKLGFSFFLFLLILSGVLFIFGKFFTREKALVDKIILLALFVLSFSLGILRYEIKDINSNQSNLNTLVGEKVVLTGLVLDEPGVKEGSTELIISPEFILSGDKELKSTARILVSTSLFPEFNYGDNVEVKGKLEKPENFESSSGNDFDYINYLAKEDVFFKISFAQTKIISSGNGSYLKNKLFSFKKAFINKLNILIKEPESSLESGLLLGAKNSLGKELQTDFRVAGVSHMVALSGYNITIVAESIMVALAFLPKVFSLSFGVMGILLFAIITGGTATVLRASIMALLVLLAKGTNRKYDITRALFLAGVFMLIHNPKILVFDISFQLSFLATLSLIFISPLVEKRMTFITTNNKMREIIVSTIATQIFVLPFLFYKMGMVSVFGLFANILIMPLIPAVMLLGFLAGIVGFISITLAIPIAFICSLILSYILKVIYVFSHIPGASITIKSFPLILTSLIYGLFIIVIWRSQKSSPPQTSLH